MIKTYVIDTNVLIQAPYALECFEDNNLVLPLVVLEELDGLKKAEGEKGINARLTFKKSCISCFVDTSGQSNPEKQWKITDEDWRNREKWDQYETAVDEMLQKTSTAYAPWHILESVDKKYARLKALRIVIEEIEKALK